MEPWSTPASTKTPSSTFTLSSVPGGGSCPTTLAQRKFAPSYTAATESTKAGAYSPFKVQLGRPDGQQEVKLVDVTLPKGLTGKLSGIPYCSEAALAAAAAKQRQGRAGRAELPGGKPDRDRLDRIRHRPDAGEACPARSTSPVPTRARRSRWR